MNNFVGITPVKALDDGFSFVCSMKGKPKGYEFGTRKGARMARARLIKALKKDGFKIMC